MDILKPWNDAVAYVEAHLCEGMDLKMLAQTACVSADSFLRFFSYVTGMTLHEYIRRRKLTLAAYELQDAGVKVMDTAVKYGYDSADAFAKAFKKQHGVLPSQVKNKELPLKVYPPASFHMQVKGAKEMDFRILETKEILLQGISESFRGAAAERFKEEQELWMRRFQELRGKTGRADNEKWYGVWDRGRYWLATEAEEMAAHTLEAALIPAGTYAVFTSGQGGYAGDELPRLRKLVFDSWIADSGYVQAADFEVEVYHLAPKTEKWNRFYELWIPLKRADGKPN